MHKHLIIDSSCFHKLLFGIDRTIDNSEIVQSSKLKHGDKIKIIDQVSEDSFIAHISQIEENYLIIEK